MQVPEWSFRFPTSLYLCVVFAFDPSVDWAAASEIIHLSKYNDCLIVFTSFLLNICGDKIKNIALK